MINVTGWRPLLSLMGLLLFFSSNALAAEAATIGDRVDQFFGILVSWVAAVTFFDILPFWDEVELPFLVAWLVAGGIFFTVRMGFINIRLFTHAIHCVRGKYDNPKDVGETSHFQALATALSATVGLGNIAGVAIAISIGGPGAMVWMIIAGFLGMSAKFAECTLGQMYREVRSDGHVMGGAMEYLSRGLADMGMAPLGKVLAVLFCLLCVMASFGGGNAFQVSQSLAAVQQEVSLFAEYPSLFGLIMVFMVGIVIIGGVKRIAHVTQAIVPSMCLLYALGCVAVILINAGQVPAALATIFSAAFSMEAGVGGLIGVLVVGFTRAAFSSEAGIGSAAIVHSTARTKYPAREGIVALLEPFIDTVVICTLTALVIVITGVYNSPETAQLVADKQGAALTGAAFGTVVPWFSIVLTVSVVLFAYSTMISWSYYGERCWSYVFGEATAMVYRVLFLLFAFLGAITSASNILGFSDYMLLAMAIPNILGMYLLQNKIKQSLDDYMLKLKSGQFERE